MEVSELSEGCNVVATTKEDSSSDGKVVKSDEVLASSTDNDEKTTRENQPRVTYTKEDLLNLRESPASKLWPSVFSDEYVRSGIWDPEPWHQSHSREKRCVSPGEELKKQLLLNEPGTLDVLWLVIELHSNEPVTLAVLWLVIESHRNEPSCHDLLASGVDPFHSVINNLYK
ncbi:Eukaryotic translation initiation factor 4E transporter [Acropora cervicornis]|uniref:Eukaryotic translation initiation factor 4E transporter n=1 Tax=Acropora cervicornis TaxID=6130 RepID=A0AAD9QJ86_ACRCE|nr:Eukaryotic translation initiation factor 4E transporter [Acropora cervicornis]